jgi:hypothetical protein
MKVTVTKEFGSPEEAAAWLRIFSPAPVEISTPLSPFTMIGPGLVESVLGTGKALPGTTPPVVTTDKKPRKPRNDAGKPRGPYKTTGADAGTTASSTPGTTSDADAVGGDPVTTESPSATPTAAASAPPASAAPATADAQAPEAQRTEPPASAAEPTFDDARDAMGRINATASLGMPECIAHLASFGINRISLLKKEDFARFIAEANAKIAAVEK